MKDSFNEATANLDKKQRGEKPVTWSAGATSRDCGVPEGELSEEITRFQIMEE